MTTLFLSISTGFSIMNSSHQHREGGHLSSSQSISDEEIETRSSHQEPSSSSHLFDLHTLYHHFDYTLRHRSRHPHWFTIKSFSMFSITLFTIFSLTYSSPTEPSSPMTTLTADPAPTTLTTDITTTISNTFNSSQLSLKRSLPELDTTDCFVTFELVSGHYLIDPPYKLVGDTPPGECLSTCAGDSKCRSVNIDYKRGTCEYLAATIDVSNEFEVSTLRASNNQNYFEKICLKNVTNFTCPSERYWSIERVRGKVLSGVPFKKVLIREAITKDDCETACINFEDFVCRSAEFNHDKKECRISPFNRFSIENDPSVKLEPVVEDIDYLENNCARGW